MSAHLRQRNSYRSPALLAGCRRRGVHATRSGPDRAHRPASVSSGSGSPSSWARQQFGRQRRPDQAARGVAQQAIQARLARHVAQALGAAGGAGVGQARRPAAGGPAPRSESPRGPPAAQHRLPRRIGHQRAQARHIFLLAGWRAGAGSASSVIGGAGADDALRGRRQVGFAAQHERQRRQLRSGGRCVTWPRTASSGRSAACSPCDGAGAAGQDDGGRRARSGRRPHRAPAIRRRHAPGVRRCRHRSAASGGRRRRPAWPRRREDGRAQPPCANSQAPSGAGAPSMALGLRRFQPAGEFRRIRCRRRRWRAAPARARHRAPVAARRSGRPRCRRRCRPGCSQ